MVVHVNIYGHMQLDSLTMEINLVVTVHVLLSQDQLLPLLLAIIPIVNLEEEVLMIQTHTTFLTHCGMVQVVLLAIHVVPTLNNHGSIIS